MTTDPRSFGAVADGRTLDLLAKYSVETLETKDGDITIFCDGEQVWAQQ